MNNFWEWFDTEARPKLSMRAVTFAKMFEYLDNLNRPVTIVETGCARSNEFYKAGDNWAGDGCSTIVFDRYVSENGGTLNSVDIDPIVTESCRGLVNGHTTITTQDSIEFLKNFKQTPDLLYLDSFDLNTYKPLASEIHHVKELEAALPIITPETLVVVDDSPTNISESGNVHIGGKGALVARYALEVGADLKFAMYQIGWTGMHKRNETDDGIINSDESLKKAVSEARKHFENDRSIDASNLYSKILFATEEPQSAVARIAHGEACVFFARASLANSKLGSALDWYEKALSVDQRAVDYRLELATKVHRKLGNMRSAKREAFFATKIEPENPNAWRILGGVEHELNNASNTIACYEKELALVPDDPDALLDMISILLDIPDYEKSTELANKVLKTDKVGEGYHALGFIAHRTSRHEEAIELLTKALEIGVVQPATVHWTRSLAAHSIGRYKEGWMDHDWRAFEKTQPALSVPMLRFASPVWNGEPPPASIHVHAEAGAGDNLCCSRYLKLLVDRGYDVRYETYSDMVVLMERSFPEVKITPQAPNYPGTIGIKQFDYHVPIGWSPRVFETDIDTVPWFGAYLKPNSELAAKYNELLPKNSKNIGLCWSSGIREGLWITEYGKRKSMHFDSLEPLRELPLNFINLQVGPERKQMKDWVRDVLPEKPDWDETAALVENLDLIICVDTAIAHLAGAMGKPVWVMCMKDAMSWHFLCERPGASWNTASPWYPSVRVFRQHRFNEPHFWDDLIKDIYQELNKGV